MKKALKQSKTMQTKYKSKDVCVLTPTKDRPHKIVNLLDSLIRQTEKVGRIIVIASGLDIRKEIGRYKSKLPVEYYYCDPPGQIRQRKLGVSKLDGRTKIVATLDDDIVLNDDAIERMIEFWNSTDVNTAGVGFNITNMRAHHYSKMREMFFFSAELPGQILESGFPTALTNVNRDISTQWLNGGATSWKQEILVEKIHKKSIDAKWAPCEDLLFSYPLSKSYNLYVNSKAKVIHDDVIVDSLNYSQLFYRGYAISMWMIYFVSLNKELVIWKTAVVILLTSFGSIIMKLLKGKFQKIGFEFGKLKGLFKGILCILQKKDPTDSIF